MYLADELPGVSDEIHQKPMVCSGGYKCLQADFQEAADHERDLFRASDVNLVRLEK